MSYILALDQGTTSSRAIVFDHDGSIRAVAQKEFQQIFPQAGWVEHDPGEIWASQIGVAVEALGRAQIKPKDIAAYFSASKIRWLLDHVPGAKARADAGKLAFGTVDSWLVWKLTNGKCHVTDVSNASRTMLFNIHTLKWDDELLRLFGIPASMLPEVRSSSEMYGEVSM